MFEEIKADCISTTRKLRKLYYECNSVQKQFDTIPFGGSIKESIGPFPEFILKGRFCKRSLLGYCTPCFYSRLPSHAITDKQFDMGYLLQVDYIINNFKKLVIDNQVGRVAFSTKTDKKVCGLVCTPTGSYFDNDEYPIDIRKTNLRKIYEASLKYNCEIALHIESHAEDVISYFLSPDEEEIELLKKLNARVILGFESVDDFYRNVFYAKQLKLSDFEKAVEVLKNCNFPVGAFVFAGHYSTTEVETIDDTTATFNYLKVLGVSPVLMFANTQRFTIPDVLMRNNEHKLLDPRTVQTIVNSMIDIFGADMDGNIDPWLIADPKGGPPEPNLHIFNSSKSTACNNCSSACYDAIERLRITKDIQQFRTDCRLLESCECKQGYLLLLRNQEPLNKIDKTIRIKRAIEIVNDNIDKYLFDEYPWIVKAELLCYGLRLTEEQFDLIEKTNPYIRERGLIHAVHILFSGNIINVCVADSFCQRSPYHVELVASQYHLFKNDCDLGQFDFVANPDWTKMYANGHQIGDFIRPHTDNCISLWPSTICEYVIQGQGCAYCCLNNPCCGTVIDNKTVVEALDIVLREKSDYEINISGGTCGGNDAAIDYISTICHEVTLKHKGTVISVECAPPIDYKQLDKLKECGVSSVIMNIEIYDEEIRKEICPGKSQCSINHYFGALKYAVDLFGRGNVSSVLIVGIQPDKDIVSACNRLIDIGVIPTLMPFKPLDNTPMENCEVVDAKRYIKLSRIIADKMNCTNLSIKCNSGCASCGACSMEINFSEV